MLEAIFYLIGIALWVMLAVYVIVIIFFCVLGGLVIGVFPAIYTSIKSYFVAINRELTNPIIRWTLNILVGLMSLSIASGLAYAIINVVSSIL